MVTAFLSLLIAISNAYNPGLTLSLNADFFVRHKQPITQLLLKVLQTVVIPDIAFD